jgi:hypothetical protein
MYNLLEVACVYKVPMCITLCNYFSYFEHVKKDSITAITVEILMTTKEMLYFRESFFNGLKVR